MADRIKTKFPGVYKRTSNERLVKGKPDICFDVTFKKDGKKIWEKVGWQSEGYSEKLASDVRAERIRAIRHGQELPQEKKKAPYLKTAWTEYFTWADKNKARGGRDDASIWKNCLSNTLAEKRMNEITSFDLERLKSALLKKDYSAATIKHALVLIRQIFNKAIAWGLYKGGNPVKGVKMPTIQNLRTRFLTHDEARFLLDELAKMIRPDLHNMALLSLYTGMRAGEIFNLKPNDTDFNNELIKIVDAKNKLTRYAYMTPAVKDMLKTRLKDNPDGFIFPDAKGKKIVQISKSFNIIINRLGFNKGINDRRELVSFHTLRHTFASWLAMQGESLLTIKELLGHKSTTMTERYSHLIPDHKRKAAARLAKEFKSGKVVKFQGDINK